MGDYIYARGTAQIRPRYIKPLQTFLADRGEHNNWDWDWAKLGEQLLELRVYSAFQTLVFGRRGTSMPGGMPNPTGWPFDCDLVDELGVATLSDDGLLVFKCSNRDLDPVVPAFISLLPVFADTWAVEVNRREQAFDLYGSEDSHVTVYAPGTASMDAALDEVCTWHRKYLRALEVRAIAKITDDERQRMLDANVSAEFIDALAGPSVEIRKHFPQHEEGAMAWSDIANAKLRAMSIDFSLFNTHSTRESESFADFCVRLALISEAREVQRDNRSLSPSATELPTSILDHINAQKLYNRGSMGVRQIKRKQRRKARA